jgi:hypothetical protein
MVGKSFTMKSDDRGSISEFKRPDDVPNNSASDPFVVRGIAFAEKPVRVGASWEVSSTMILPEYGPTDVVLVHRLEGVDKGKATIETQVRIDKDKVLLPDGMTITKNCGTCVLELATGKLLEARAELAWASTRGAGNKMEMSMTTTVQAIEPPPAKPAAGTEAPPTRGKG